MATEKDTNLVSGTFSAKDLANLIHQMSESNKDAYREFAKELASRIVHPEPTEEERKRYEANAREAEENAAMAEADRTDRRAHCCPPASPHAPHRRSGASWGMFNGSSVIAWNYTQRAHRDSKTGRTIDSNPFPVGVCMWCNTTFVPGDSNYEEAISWGLSQTAGAADMNVRTGLWVNG